MRFFLLALTTASAVSAANTGASSDRDMEQAALESILAYSQDPAVIAREQEAANLTSLMTDCVDSPAGWMDAMENDCSWYEDYPSQRCIIADMIASEEGSGDDVCCVCGGGKSYDDLDEEEQDEVEPFQMNLGCGACVDEPNFLDLVDNDCDYYAANVDKRCPFAHAAAIDGYSAKEACCACGGGESKSCDGEYYIYSVLGSNYMGILYGRIRPPYVVIFPNKALWSKLRIKEVGKDIYAIGSTYYEDRWVCVGGDGEGVTSCETIGKAAKWTIEATSSKRTQYRIKSIKDGRYMSYVGINTDTGEYSIALVNKAKGAAVRWKLESPHSDDYAEDYDFTLANASEKKNLRSVSA